MDQLFMLLEFFIRTTWLNTLVLLQGSSKSVVMMEWDKIWAVNKKVCLHIHKTCVWRLQNTTKTRWKFSANMNKFVVGNWPSCSKIYSFAEGGSYPGSCERCLNRCDSETQTSQGKNIPFIQEIHMYIGGKKISNKKQKNSFIKFKDCVFYIV